MLHGKVAVIYGAGSIGSTVAKAFAAAGAQVHLAGRTQATLDAVAGEIRAAGGDAHTAVVDALDPAAVRQHADRVAAEAGHIDICFNLIGHGDVHGTPLIDMDTVVTGGISETIGDDVDPAVVQGIVDATMIGKAATYEDVGNVAVFAASDQARMMTAAT